MFLLQEKYEELQVNDEVVLFVQIKIGVLLLLQVKKEVLLSPFIPYPPDPIYHKLEMPVEALFSYT